MTPAVTIFETRLPEAAIAGLRALVGSRVASVACRHLTLYPDQALARARSVAFQIARRFPPAFVEIACEALTAFDDVEYLALAVRETDRPLAVDVTPGPGPDAVTIAEHAAVRLDGWGAIESIEIVGFTRHWSSDVGSDAQTLACDRALRFRHADGRCLTLSARIDEWNALVDIRWSESIGDVDADDLVETRLTLH